MSAERERPAADGRLGSVSALMRLGAGAYLRGVAWSAGSSIAAARRVSEALRDGESAADLFGTVRDETVQGVRRALGVTEIEERLGRVAPARAAAQEQGENGETPARPSRAALRRRAEELLRQSADVRDHVDTHPAFLAIVDELAPDEVRILRLLHEQGPQAVLDFHLFELSGEIDKVGRVSFVATEAGLLHPDLLAEYIDNLSRLGLVRVARIAVADDAIYEVLGGQPEAEEARRGGGLRGLQVRPGRRSLTLTDLGEAFCEAALGPAAP